MPHIRIAEYFPFFGLGLILCRDMVDKNGGTIWAESEKEHGSAFFFTLSVSPD